MARGNYAPEIRSSIGDSPKGRLNTSPRKPKAPGPNDSPADVARDKQRGIPEGSPRDEAIDTRAIRSVPQAPQPPVPPHMQMQGGPDPHSVGAATSIAHAILQGKGGGY